MREKLTKSKGLLLDILFPPVCIVCRSSLASREKTDGICKACALKVPLFTTLFCARCNARLPLNKKICHHSSYYRLGAATSYDNPITKHLIWELKYKGHTAASPPLASFLARYLENLDFSFESFSIIPIPLHKRRLRERGFNQSELIATHISKNMNFPILLESLMRRKYTAPQAEFRDFELRKTNVENCFEVHSPKTIQGNNILLVDDVTTSHATLEEAVAVLKTAGAKKIVAVVVAKAG